MITKRRITFFCIVLAALIYAHKTDAQQFALKTNLLYGFGTLTPNLGAEIALGNRTTLDLWGGYNPWKREGTEDSNKKLVHWIVQPEFRYWPCQKFNGHFFGVHALYTQYNISGHHVPQLFESQYRYQGNTIGGGISYGYHWMLNRRWGVEFNVGVGAAYFDYDQYGCGKCENRVGQFSKTYFGPTKAGISLVYIIK